MQPPGLDTEENLSLEEKIEARASATSGYLGYKSTVGPVKPRKTTVGSYTRSTSGKYLCPRLDGEEKGFEESL